MTIYSGKLVFDISGSEFLLGLVASIFGIGTIILNFVGGVIADRFEKKILLIITSLAMAITLLILALVDAFDYETVAIIITICSILGFITGIDWPLRVSIFIDFIDDKSHIVSAVALNSLLWQGMRILAPGLGGFIIAYYGTPIIFFMSSVGFLIMAIALMIIRYKPSTSKPKIKKSFLNETMEGIYFIAEDKVFRVIIIISYLTMGFAMSYLQLIPSLTDMYKNTSYGNISSQVMGILLSVGGIGAVTGNIITSRIKNKINLGKITLGMNVISVILVFFFGLSNLLTSNEYIYDNPWISLNLSLSIIFIFFAGISNAIFIVCSITILQMKVPENLRGRVMGIHTITFSMLTAGALVLGIVAEFLSSSVSIMIFSGALIIFNSIIYIKNPIIKSIN